MRLVEYFERFDWTLFLASLALTALGLITIYGIGISQEQVGLFTFYKQLIAMVLGGAIVVCFTFVDYRHLRSLGLVSYLVGALLLAAVLVFGQTVNGTQGWFRLGSISFQPVEVAKLALVLYLAAFFARYTHGRLTWRAFILSGSAVLLYVFLVMLQPDFGSAMVLVGIWFILCLFAGLPRRGWIILPVACALLVGLVWSVGLKPYQRDRIATFLDPNADPHGSGYNAAQARIAIGSGGWFGKGLGEGSQARLRFLPESATDFIFAVVGEELGFVGLSLVIGLFLLVIVRLLWLAHDSRDDFAALAMVGVAGILLIHVTVNAGMNLGIMPITGIPLPFVSAAASYLVVTYFSVGLAQSIAVRRISPLEREE